MFLPVGTRLNDSNGGRGIQEFPFKVIVDSAVVGEFALSVEGKL